MTILRCHRYLAADADREKWPLNFVNSLIILIPNKNNLLAAWFNINLQWLCQFTSKSGLIFLLWKSESKIKSVVQVAYGSLRRCDVQICLQKKPQRICKMKSKEDKILIKILWQEKRYGTKKRDCLQSSPTNIGHNCEVYACSGRSMTPWLTCRQLASGRKRKAIIKQKYSIISVKIFWFCV